MRIFTVCKYNKQWFSVLNAVRLGVTGHFLMMPMRRCAACLISLMGFMQINTILKICHIPYCRCINQRATHWTNFKSMPHADAGAPLKMPSDSQTKYTILDEDRVAQ